MTVIGFDELAELARENKLPEFLTSRFKGSKEVLLHYPDSMPKNMVNWMLALMFLGSTLIFSGTYAVGYFFSPLAAILPFVLGVLFATLGLHGLVKYGRKEDALIGMGKVLSKITDWTDTTPAEFGSLSYGQQKGLIDTMMTSLCKGVLDFQEEKRGQNPDNWRLDHQMLMDEIATRFDTLKPFGPTPAGYGYYFTLAKEG